MRVARDLPIAEPADHCASGGIGRRTGFRFQRRKAWRFDPSLAHNSETVGEKETALGSRVGVGPVGDLSGHDSTHWGARARAVAALGTALSLLIDSEDRTGTRIHANGVMLVGIALA